MVSGMKREKVFEVPLCGPRKRELRWPISRRHQAYVVATVDPSHGEMDVYVDGQKLATVNTQSPSRKRSQKVYETPDLAAGSHNLTLVNSKGDAIATEGIYALNNQEKGLFEFAQPILAVKKRRPSASCHQEKRWL